MNSLRSTSLISLAFLAAPLAVFAQGTLTPAGAPAPMMKTLAQIEARTDVKTLPGDATAMHVIAQPGSYYLTGDVVGAAGKGGIRIECDNVSLDLNGFTIWGPGTANTTQPGIYLPNGDVTSYFWISIRNGCIRQWGGGGVHAGQSGSLQLEDLRIRDVGSYGIRVLGGSTQIERCHVSSARDVGISIDTVAGADVIIRDCVVYGIAGAVSATGIYSGGGIVEGCRVNTIMGPMARGIVSGVQTGRVAHCDVTGVAANLAGNYAVGIDAAQIESCNISNTSGTNGASAYGVYPTFPGQVLKTRIAGVTGYITYGIYAAAVVDDFNVNGATTVESCIVANLNCTNGAVGILARSVLDCQVVSVQGTNAGGSALGIGVHTGGLIKDCTVTNVEGDGISLTQSSSAIGNSVHSAGRDGSGVGILIAVGGCRVEGNRVTGSPIGISQASGTSLVIGNFAQNNTTNFSGVPAALVVSTAAAVASGSSVLNVSY